MEKVKFLEEKPGVQSYIRLQSLILLAAFLSILFYEVYKDVIHFEVLVLVLTGAIAPKVIQKFSEEKTSRNKTTTES